MAEHSSIEWTDATWNPVTGCSVVSPGCTNCYAMKLAGTRLRGLPSRTGLTIESKAGPVWNGRVRLNEQWLTQPLRWRRPRKIFVCAHGDLFAENVPDEWIDRVFAVMALAPQHTFQVLTKRAARMRAYLTAIDAPARIASGDLSRAVAGFPACDALAFNATWPLPNVWLGVSAEDQRRADERVPDLLATPAAVRFVSAEPLIGAIDFTQIDEAGADSRGFSIHALTGHPARRIPGLDWIIAGGESGSAARPMHPTWVRRIRDACAQTGVAFHFKQWGAWQPREWCRDGGTHAMRNLGGQISFQQIQSHPNSLERVGAGPEWSAFANVGKKAAGRLLDGMTHDAFPEARHG